jgi:hypothetical protein
MFRRRSIGRSAERVAHPTPPSPSASRQETRIDWASRTASSTSPARERLHQVGASHVRHRLGARKLLARQGRHARFARVADQRCGALHLGDEVRRVSTM